MNNVNEINLRFSIDGYHGKDETTPWFEAICHYSIDEMYRKSLKFVYSVMNSNNSIVAHIG